LGFRNHQWMYDERSLVALIERSGFCGAKRAPAGTTRIEGFGLLNLREREDESLVVEAVRGP
jgi:hypothetical protein